MTASKTTTRAVEGKLSGFLWDADRAFLNHEAVHSGTEAFLPTLRQAILGATHAMY